MSAKESCCPKREVCCSQQSRGESHLVPLASDLELSDLELALLSFRRAVVHYFLMPHFFLLEW